MLVCGLICLPGCSIERFLNKRAQDPPYPVSGPAAELHHGIWVADLHADSLLWNRPLHRERRTGHLDLPRLQRGGVDFFVASTVSKAPFGLNMESNRGDSDLLIANSIIQFWPARTWGDILQRVLYQGERLRRFAADSGGSLRIVASKSELARLVRDQETEPIVGTLLATEGGHVLKGDIENLEALYQAGFRMMGLVHFFDNELGGSAHGIDKGGITEFGEQVVTEMERRGMIVDLAHASPRLFDDVLAIATRPVVVSHTGVQGTCPGPRNLSDQQLDAIQANDGLVGIAVFEPALCELSYEATAQAFRYVADRIGIRHVALGTDFDGAVVTPTDASGIGLLTQAMLEHGFSGREVEAIMGGNARRVLLQGLPE